MTRGKRAKCGRKPIKIDPKLEKLGAPARPRASQEDLAAKLSAILSRDPDNELKRLLLEMCDAGQLEACAAPLLNHWQAKTPSAFASRADALENWVSSGIAELFLGGHLVFATEFDESLDVFWVRSSPGTVH